MNGLIVAAVAGVAGIAGVVGLSSAATGGDEAPATTTPVATLTSTAPEALSARLERLRAAERAADDALRREVPTTTSGTTMTSSAPVTAPTASRSTDDDGTLDQGPGDRDPVTGALIDDDRRGGDRDRGRDRDDDDRGDDGHRGGGRGGDDEGDHRGRGHGEDD
jgi:hypothetical protein